MGRKKPTSAPRDAENAVPTEASDLLNDLREIYKNLDAVDTRTMSPEQQQTWFEEYTKTRQAIMVLETNTLAVINDRLGALADNVTRAIDDCEKSLHGVLDTAVVIQTVAVALGAIAQIALLLV